MAENIKDVVTASRKPLNERDGSRYGLVIGIEKYRDERLNLPYARGDAQAVYDLMIDPACGMFPKNNVVLLLDDAASFLNIRWKLDDLKRKAEANDMVWVYYAGHGAPEGDDFFWVPCDGNIDQLRLTGISRQDINRSMDGIKSERRIMFLDCCYAEVMARQRDKTWPVLNPAEWFKSFNGQGSTILAATGGRQHSVELDQIKHGIFTYHLVQGLGGAADISNSGVVTLADLWSYLADKVGKASAIAGTRQIPLLDGPQTTKLVLTLNAQKLVTKNRMTEYLGSLIGPGEDHLSSEEVDFCLEMLRSGSRDTAEEIILSELDSLIADTTTTHTFKKLVVLARNQVRHGADDVLGAKSNLAARYAFDQLENDLKQRGVPVPDRITHYRNFAATWPATNAGQEALKRIEDHMTSPNVPPLTDTDEKENDSTTQRLRHGVIGTLDLGNDIKLEMVYLEGGTFQMGSPDTENGRFPNEGPVHEVELDGFWIGRYEVTQIQYETLVGVNPSGFNGAEHPVVGVSWKDVVEYCKKLNKMTGLQFRLPTEAEWEYACRAGSQTSYYFGDSQRDLKNYAWFAENAPNRSHPVGMLEPNTWGLYDMHGNVWEWCSDRFASDYYEHSSRKNPEGPDNDAGEEDRVLRGGSWISDASFCRSAYRSRISPDRRNDDAGFRLFLSVMSREAFDTNNSSD